MQESTKCRSKLNVVNEFLDTKVKILISNLKKFTKSFSELRLVNENLEGFNKQPKEIQYSTSLLFKQISEIVNLPVLNKPIGNRGCSGYTQTHHNNASTSKTTFVTFTNQPRYGINLKLENKSILGQRPTRQGRINQPRNRYQQSRRFGPMFIPTCFNCCEL